MLAIFQGISAPSDRNERPPLASFLSYPPESPFFLPSLAGQGYGDVEEAPNRDRVEFSPENSGNRALDRTRETNVSYETGEPF